VPADHPARPSSRSPGGRKAAQGTGSRRERNKQDKLRRIKQAARRLFYERGFEATTTQAIAEAADIGTGTLFSYVRVKEDLLLMVFLDDLLEVIDKALKSTRSGVTLIDKVLHLFDALLRFHARDAELSRHFTRETYAVRSPERRADLFRLLAAILEPIAQMVVDEQASGDLRADIEPRLVAWQLFAFYFGAVSGIVNSQSANSQSSLREGRALLRDASNALFRGLHP
jgi:AcrR family transcriptional regulator